MKENYFGVIEGKFEFVMFLLSLKSEKNGLISVYLSGEYLEVLYSMLVSRICRFL